MTGILCICKTILKSDFSKFIFLMYQYYFFIKIKSDFSGTIGAYKPCHIPPLYVNYSITISSCNVYFSSFSLSYIVMPACLVWVGFLWPICEVRCMGSDSQLITYLRQEQPHLLSHGSSTKPVNQFFLVKQCGFFPRL